MHFNEGNKTFIPRGRAICVGLSVRVIGLCNAHCSGLKRHDCCWDWAGSGLCFRCQELEPLKLETRKGLGKFVVFAKDVFCRNEYVTLQS